MVVSKLNPTNQFSILDLYCILVRSGINQQSMKNKTYLFVMFPLGGRSAPDPPEIFAEDFRKNSFDKSLIRICMLCIPPYKFPPVMKIPMPNWCKST